ncbi:hypothetical protein CPB86DRAFT_585870 [Serendipita vermifera]|nr:hypothetical protein CPB86DRAFT_585870 [Serendipita vermifera]
MKRHWLTHHTNEGPWIPDRYPPFEDLWKLVKEGEIVLTPPSKYAYDSPMPEHMNTASPPAPSSLHSGDGPNTGSGRRNSIAIDTDQRSFSNQPEFNTRDTQVGPRRNSFSGRLTWSPIDSRRSREVRISRGNNRPWKYSDPVGPYEGEDGEVDELNEVDGDVDMEDGTHDEALSAGRFVSASPSHHSQQSLRDSPAHSHYSRSQRSNSNPKSPASLRSLALEHQDPADVHIHVQHARIPPITSLSPASEAEPAILRRLPLHPTSNYPLVPTSHTREHDTVYNKTSDGLDLLAVSAARAHGKVYASENHNPRSIEIVKLGQGSFGMVGQYVYGHKKESPPAPTFMPASIPHSELSLLSHPPTDRILPSSPRASGTTNSTGTADKPLPPTHISTEADSFADSYTPHGAWQSHHQSQRGAAIPWPITVATH